MPFFMAGKKQVIRILIAHDHSIFRDGLKSLLADEPKFQIVGEACDGEETLRLVEQIQPDILLLNHLMPRMSGIEVLRSLAESHNKARTILLNGVAEGEEIFAAFESGARGVVLMESTTTMLFKSIRIVMAGQYWIDSQGVSDPAQTLERYKKSNTDARPKNYGLTSREIGVLDAVASGYSNKEVAGQLSISEQTVKHHITNIFDKLGVYNRLELTLFAIHHRLIVQ
jgi:two-component system, NarL family, nitrate/nitrite response regulator NarL